MYISIILFWLLCGSWAIRMEEKATKSVVNGIPESCIVTGFGCLSLLMGFYCFWLPRLWEFLKGIRKVWEESLKV